MIKIAKHLLQPFYFLLYYWQETELLRGTIGWIYLGITFFIITNDTYLDDFLLGCHLMNNPI